MSYLERQFIINEPIKTIFELGSRDLEDSIKLSNYYNAEVYAFECNPDCLEVCYKKLENYKKNLKNVHLIDKAVSLDGGPITFHPFDLTKYNNMGSSSIFLIDFTKRDRTDPDYNRENPQKSITVDSIRLDDFMEKNCIDSIDLLCIDLQGYELNAIKSLGEKLKKVKYIITECSITSTYIGGATFTELKDYLESFGFKYKCSNLSGESLPNLHLKGFSEFDAMFVKI
jgi:FkbM family methyltransferase